MSGSAESLRELHRLHIQATELRNRLARGPKQIKAREGNLAHAESGLEETKEKHKKSQLLLSQKELNLKERENRILDIKAKLNSASSNREYTTFVEQIAADEQANSVLADEILELYDKVSDDKDLVTAAEKVVADSKSQLEEMKKKIADAKAGLESELAAAEAGLVEAEKMLPGDVKQEYDRVVKAHGEEALAPIEEEVCGGCYVRITSQMLNELVIGEKMVFCKQCGRLLYVPEGTQVS